MYRPVRNPYGQPEGANGCGRFCCVLLGVVTLGLFCVCILPFVMSPDNAVNFPYLQPSISEAEIDGAFENFVDTYKLNYGSAEEAQIRRRAFAHNYRSITIFNSQPQRTCTLAINQFADLTDEEFAARYLSAPRKAPTIAHSWGRSKGVDPTIKKNWVAEGKVSPVKDQGNCGSCWTFSSISVTETLQAIRRNKSPLQLAEQQLVDCCITPLSHGCSGGEPTDAFNYIKAKGIALSADYPYKAQDLPCKDKQVTPVLKLAGYVNITEGKTSDMENAIKTRTMAVGINASPYVFRFYKSGVIDVGCPSDPINHGVTVVGADTDENKVPYWLVRNSWGATWGDKGYVKLKRTPDGNPGVCGIALFAQYVLFEEK